MSSTSGGKRKMQKNMPLITGNPFWTAKDGIIASYPRLNNDLTTDVVVIGGGITGALVAHHLSQNGIEAVLLDKRDFGAGSTSGSTAHVSYELDISLYKLIEMIGEKKAVRSYELCRDAIGDIKNIINSFTKDGYEDKSNLTLANNQEALTELSKEYEARKKYGFHVDYLEQSELKSRLGINALCGLASQEAIQIDPFKITYLLIREAVKKGLKAYDQTTIIDYKAGGNSVLLKTNKGVQIKTKKVIFATGYESLNFLKKLPVQVRTDFVLISEPVSNLHGLDKFLIWEATSYYLYISTFENRIMIGAEEEYVGENKREELMKIRSEQIVKRFNKYIPDITIEIAYSWAGTFVKTKDSLPYFGTVKKYPHAIFALGYGGNGIAFSTVLARMTLDMIKGKKNPDYNLFNFDRQY